MNQNRWSSRLNFILATTGAAVGLGSIWKFPYMAGANGGGAFVLILLVATVFIGIPIMMAEILLGRLGRANPVATMRYLAKQQQQPRQWQWLGWWGALALVLVLSFYSVIAGWSIAYFFKSVTGVWQSITPAEIQKDWAQFLSNPLQLLLWHSLFIFLTLWVVARGVHRGLEKASRIMMPGLFIVLLILMIASIFIGDFQQALVFLFKPDFSKITPSVAIDALGQAAFSLAIGAGCMLVYGCYTTENTKLAINTCLIASLIILVSILSGLAIFPLVFQYELSPQGGPGLMFHVLPIVLSHMPAGHFFGSLFFLMLLFAAWTSSISMAEPLVVILTEEFKMTRLMGAILVGILTWALGGLAMLSFNLLGEFKILGRFLIFDAMADFATNIILPTGAFCFAIFAGWFIEPTPAKQALGLSSFGFWLWRFLVRWIAPTAILLVFIYQWFD